MSLLFKRTTLISAIFLFLILSAGAILRINNLEKNPPGFYTDEASIGYNAYTILTTLRDEHGNFMPIFFKAFGEYKNFFSVYPVVPFIAIFGPSEFAVRLTGAVWGLLDILLIYFLASELWGKKAGVVSSLVLATSPWHMHLSRFLIESHNAFLFFVLGGTLFLVKAQKANWRLKYTLLAAVFWGLSFYTYFATRIFTPLFLLGCVFIFRKEVVRLFEQRKNFLISTAIFVAVVFPFLIHMVTGGGFARYRQVSFAGTNLSSYEIIKKSGRLYFDHIAPKFVFFTGDSDFPGQMNLRHSISGIGLFYKWQLPFFVLGFLAVLFSKMRAGKTIVLMLILYPLGSIVSNVDTPLATRSVVGVIPYSLLTGYGLFKFFGWIKPLGKPLIWWGLMAMVVFLWTFYLQRFIDLGGAYMNRAYGYAGFQYGAREIIFYFLENQNKYDAAILYGGFDGPEAYIKFYGLGKCIKCYAEDPKPDDYRSKKLISVAPEKLAEFKLKYRGVIKKTIYYPDGREAFYIYEAKRRKID